MRSIITKLTPKSLINRILTPSPPSQTPPFSLSVAAIATAAYFSTETKSQKIDRIATELLSLNAVELHDYSILFGLKMGLKNSALAAGPGPSSQSGNAAEGAAEKEKEKTVFEVKLEKYDAEAKIKIIKEVRSFTDLGLKEAKDLVEKVPAVVKTGVSKEEGEAIVAKLKLLGASVVLE